MPLAAIIRLGLDQPPLTSQELADLALAADRDARKMEATGSPRALWFRLEADALADACADRAHHG